ncbi:hypothetical protein DPMN_053135 [Dreissena polymorpha]|uniref:C2H2-type domain-containing protein n=1 Tax=Dreissena polymorpha TaxID=45954 RepID=A0A9D4CN59_DREPO|nr:hypothetical protein DPMN_053135 [Dreissena polymorpha]
MNRFVNGGLAYRFSHCGKVERKGRLVAHILRDHVPEKQVPFFCTLCKFVCETKDDLSKHLTKYSGHVRAAGISHNIDLKQTLIKSNVPWFVSANDMTPIREEEDDMFKEPALPPWLLDLRTLKRKADFSPSTMSLPLSPLDTDQRYVVPRSFVESQETFSDQSSALLNPALYTAPSFDEDPLTALVQTLKTPQPSPKASVATPLQDEPVDILPTEQDKADPLLYEVITTSEKVSQTEKGQFSVELHATQRASETTAQACQATARNTEQLLDELRSLERRVTSIERTIDRRRRDKET